MSHCYGIQVTKRSIVIQTGIGRQGLPGPPGNQQVASPLTLIGNSESELANPRDMTVPEVKALLGYASTGDLATAVAETESALQAALVEALATYSPTVSYSPIAFSGSASDLGAGTLPNARLSPQVVRNDFTHIDPTWLTINWDKISSKPVTFAPTPHLHAVADVNGLQTALDNRVVGPAAGITNSLARFSDNTGKLLKESPTTTIDGSGMFNHTGVLQAATFRTDGSSGYQYYIGGVEKYRLYMLADGSDRFYIRDAGNNRQHITLNPNSNVDLALTDINSQLLVRSPNIQIGSSGPRIRWSTGQPVSLRNAADTGDFAFAAGAGTFSGVVSPNAGIAWSSSQVITSAVSQISLASTNSGAAGGVRLLLTNDVSNFGYLSMHGSGTSSAGLGDKFNLVSSKALRLISSGSSINTGTDSIEVSPGGYNRPSADFPAAGGVDLLRGGVRVSGFNTRTKLLECINSTYSDVSLIQHGWVAGEVNYGASLLFNAQQPYEGHSTSFRTELIKRTSSINRPVLWQSSNTRSQAFSVAIAPVGTVGDDVLLASWESLFGISHNGLVAINASTAGAANAAMTLTGNFTSGAAGIQRGIFINSTYSQSGSAGSADLRIQRTETSLGSGTQHFIDCIQGSGRRFAVTNSGDVYMNGSLSGIGGISLISGWSLGSGSSTINMASSNNGTSGGARVMASTNDGVLGMITVYNTNYTTASLAGRTLFAGSGSVRIASQQSGPGPFGSSVVEISPGGHSNVSASFATEGGMDLIRGNLSVTAGYISSGFQSIAGDPTTLDLSAGLSRLVKNTTSGEIRHWINDAGVLKKSPAYT